MGRHNILRRKSKNNSKITLIAGNTTSWTTSISLISDINDVQIDWGDGSVIENVAQNTTISHNFTYDGVDKQIKIYSSSTELNKFICNSSSLKSIDFSNVLLNINSDFQVTDNSNLDEIIYSNDNNLFGGQTCKFTNTGFTILDFSKVKIDISGDITSKFDLCPNLTNIVFKNTNNIIQGSFDVSNCPNIINLDLSYVQINTTSRGFNLSNCTSLNNVIFSSYNNTINYMYAISCNSLTILNFTGVLISSGGFNVRNNSLLETIVFDVNKSNTLVATANIYSNPKLTQLDFSNVTINVASLIINNNTLLNSVIFKTTTNTITSAFLCYSNPNISNLDFTNVTLTCTNFRVQDDTILNSIIFKNSIGNTFNTWFLAYNCNLQNGFVNSEFINWGNNAIIRLQNNNMTTIAVNKELYNRDLDIDGGGEFNVSGTNSAPDGTSGGYDGLTAKANLIAKGVTVTTN